MITGKYYSETKLENKKLDKNTMRLV